MVLEHVSPGQPSENDTLVVILPSSDVINVELMPWLTSGSRLAAIGTKQHPCAAWWTIAKRGEWAGEPSRTQWVEGEREAKDALPPATPTKL